MKNKTRSVVVFAVILALTVVLGALPFVFLLPLLFTAVTEDMKKSLAAGLFFGIVSLAYSVMGGSIVAAAFLAAPYIAIIPRIFVGFAARGVFVLARRLLSSKRRFVRSLPYALSAAAGSLANTVTVVSLLVIFMRGTVYEGVTMLGAVPLMLISGAIELVIAAAVIPPLAAAVKRALNPGIIRDIPIEIQDVPPGVSKKIPPDVPPKTAAATEPEPARKGE
ncbi:MAG: hypothetical protein LBP26_04405 [Clostridiales bacterium]|jgi:uncharacterized membrane protein|nr:hypothetical protein [Clostridiales bacterium]